MSIDVTVDEETGAAYIYLQGRDAKSARTDEIEEGFLIDFDDNGHIIGFEILEIEGENRQKQAVARVLAYLTGQLRTHALALDELREYATAV